MSDTLRKQILDKSKSMLQAVTDDGGSIVFGDVFVSKVSPIDLETVSYPCAFVYSGPEKDLNVSGAPNTYESWDWIITIEVWARDEDMEDLLKYVHKKFAELYPTGMIGGLAIDVKRKSCSGTLSVDPTKSLAAIMMDFSVQYRHVFGSPDTV